MQHVAYYLSLRHLDTGEVGKLDGPYGEFDARWRAKWQHLGNQTRWRCQYLVKVKIK